MLVVEKSLDAPVAAASDPDSAGGVACCNVGATDFIALFPFMSCVSSNSLLPLMKGEK